MDKQQAESRPKTESVSDFCEQLHLFNGNKTMELHLTSPKPVMKLITLLL